MRAPLTIAVCLLAASCGDDDGDPKDMSVVATSHNFKQINADIIVPNCTFSSCHSQAGKTDSKLNLCSAPDPSGTTMQVCQPTATVMDAYQALVDQIPDNTRAQNEGLKLVSPCHPEQSFILVKLRLPTSATDPDVDYGEHMPKDAQSLLKSEILSINDWIARGAHFDEPDDVTGDTCVVTPDLSALD